MMRFNKATTFLVIAAVSAIVAGGVYMFFFFSMKNKTEAAINLSAQSSQFSGERARRVRVASSLQASKDDVGKLSSYFIKESEIVAFTKRIEALGTQAGVALSIQSLEPGLLSGDMPFLNFRIVATGKFQDIQRLLVFLQNFPGKFEWRNLRLVREGDAQPETGKPTQKVVPVPQWNVEASLVALNFVKG